MPLIREDCGTATMEFPQTTAGWARIITAKTTADATIDISTFTYFGNLYARGVLSATVMTIAYHTATGGILCSLTVAQIATLAQSGTYEIGYIDLTGKKFRLLRGNYLKV